MKMTTMSPDIPTISIGEQSRIAAAVPEGLKESQAELSAALARRRLWTAVRAALRRAKLSQSDVSRILKVNRSTVSRAMSSPSNLTIDKAGRIARAAGFYLKIDVEPVNASCIYIEKTDQAGSDVLKIVHRAPNNNWIFARFENVQTDSPLIEARHISLPDLEPQLLKQAPMSASAVKSRVKCYVD